MKKEKVLDFVQRLAKLQAEKNGNRGVSCIRTMIGFLLADQLDKAKAVAFNESDKISTYPDIKELIETELFSEGESTPWTRHPHALTS